MAWLLVFPNAPYLLMDFIHLRPRQGIHAFEQLRRHRRPKDARA